jgi:hypothetical protein
MVLLLGGLREKDKLKDSGLKMELFHLEAGIHILDVEKSYVL